MNVLSIALPNVMLITCNVQKERMAMAAGCQIYVFQKKVPLAKMVTNVLVFVQLN